MSKFDLHMHSNASLDGQFTPAELIEIAKERGMETIALTDHDTVQNVRAIREEAKKAGIELIDGIEVSTNMGQQGVHLLGYGVDLDDPWLNSLNKDADKKMVDSFYKRAALVEKKYGLKLDPDEAVRKAEGGNPWFVFMNELFASPIAEHIEDFQDYRPGGKRSSPAPINFFWDKCQAGSDLFVPAFNPDLAEAIDRVHAAGGLAIIAHPFRTFYQKPELLEHWIEAGIDGLEAYSNYHTPEMNEWYRQFAQDHNLLITCGSDFHGKTKPDIVMGEYHLDHDGTPYLEAFKAALANRNR